MKKILIALVYFLYVVSTSGNRKKKPVMSYMTKDQLENYLNGLPASNNKKKAEYSQLKSELVYPMQKLSVSEQVEDEEEATYESIQERMKRLRNATGTVMSTTETMTPAFPATPRPMTATKPSSFSKQDAFEASLNPRLYSQKFQSVPHTPVATSSSPQKPAPSTPPPPPPPMRETPPPAVPNSPRPPKPTPATKESMVRTLNPIYAGLDCPACQKPIAGSVVSAMDQIWHVSCFTCAGCHKPLENEKYYEKDNKPYCGKDYRNMFSLHCDFCHEPIIDSAINALGKHYHEGHFCCTACGEPFGDHSAFMMHEDKPYCQDDYFKLCGRKCNGCGQYISGEYINALDQEWHKSCFNCFVCKMPFTNGTFLVRDNKPYCEEHFHHYQQRQSQQRSPQERNAPAVKPKPAIAKKPDFTSKPTSQSEIKRPEINKVNSGKTEKKAASTGGTKVCHQCNTTIDGPSANALGYDYHIHHFQCSHCSRALSSRVPGMWQGGKNNELVCKMCMFKLSQQ